MTKLTISQERGERLRSLRKKLRYSRRELAEKHELSAASLQNWEDGRYNGMNNRSAEIMAKIFEREGLRCKAEWLLYGTGENPIPSSPSNLASPTFETTIPKELQYFHQLNPGSVDLMINDDMMFPFYQVGDYVAGKRYYQEHLIKTIGFNCIIQTDKGGILVRKIIKHLCGNTYRVEALNPQLKKKQSQQDIILFSSAPILWVRRECKII